MADHPSKGLMVSNMDLHKIIDPVLRPTYIANRRSFNTVVIDPGHGGHDSGTRNRISREADINLSVAKKLRDRLKGMGYQVVMTRDTDNFITLQDRVRIANRHSNAIFISIHFNDGGPSARGWKPSRWPLRALPPPCPATSARTPSRATPRTA